MTKDPTAASAAPTGAMELTPVYQDKFGLDWTQEDAGNCLQACIATVFGLALEDVPHFVRAEDNHDAMNRWLVDRYGLYVLAFPSTGPEPWAQGYYFQSGEGPRGGEHVVVMRDGVMVHDPIAPNGPGLSVVKCTWVFVAREPATLTADLAAERARTCATQEALRKLDHHINGHMGWMQNQGAQWWDAFIREPKDIIATVLSEQATCPHQARVEKLRHLVGIVAQDQHERRQQMAGHRSSAWETCIDAPCVVYARAALAATEEEG